MPKLIFIVPAFLAAGCAAQRTENTLAAAEANAATLTLVAQVDPAPAVAAEPQAAAQPQAEAIVAKTVAIEELDNGLVCEPRQRSASRITRRVCYTREEYAVVQELQREQAQKYARDLSRDQELREAQQRAEQDRRRPQPGM